jgi:hypothetical protein
MASGKNNNEQQQQRQHIYDKHMMIRGLGRNQENTSLGHKALHRFCIVKLGENTGVERKTHVVAKALFNKHVIKDKRRREAPKALFWQILDLGISRTE